MVKDSQISLEKLFLNSKILTKKTRKVNQWEYKIKKLATTNNNNSIRKKLSKGQPTKPSKRSTSNKMKRKKPSGKNNLKINQARMNRKKFPPQSTIINIQIVWRMRCKRKGREKNLKARIIYKKKKYRLLIQNHNKLRKLKKFKLDQRDTYSKAITSSISHNKGKQERKNKINVNINSNDNNWLRISQERRK